MSTSLVGDGILLVALAWQVYSLYGVPAAMSTVGVALSLPQVATLLLGGVVSDRFDRRRVMLASDLVRAGCLALLAVLALSGHLALPGLLAITATYGAAAGFFGPSFDAYVPTLVPEPELVAANAIDQFIRPAAVQILGPAAGGVLVAATGAGWAFAADAVTFLVSATCLLRIGATGTAPAAAPAEEATGGSIWRELRDGFGYVRRNVWLWGTFLAATFAYLLFIGPTEVLLPYVVKHELHGSAGDLGLILSSGGLGAILAATIVGQVGVPRARMPFIYYMWTFATLAVAGYGLAQHSWQLALACTFVNGLEAAGTIAWATAKQTLVPAHLLGRVSSVDWFISIALVPLSYALAAPAAQLIGARHTLIGAGVLGALVTFAFLYLPGMRTAGLPAPATPAPAAAGSESSPSGTALAEAV